jgi:hypothetical protein
MAVEDPASYFDFDFAERMRGPHILSAAEIIGARSSSRQVLDLGCADGVAAGVLPDFTMYGIDSDGRAIADAQQRFPGNTYIAGDIRSADYTDPRYAEVDSVLAMDVLHCLSRSETADTLTAIRQGLQRRHSIVASTLAQVPYSIETWLEARRRLGSANAYPYGFFGSQTATHGGLHTYRSVFRRGGYDIVRSWRMNRVIGVEGEWLWQGHDGPPELTEFEDSATGPVVAKAARFTADAYRHARASGNGLAARLFGALLVRSNLLLAEPLP